MLNIINKLKNGNNIYEFDDLNELLDRSDIKIKDEDVIIINYDSNVNYHGYYEYKILKKIIDLIKEIIKDTYFIEGEDNKFIYIYTKLAQMLSFDHDAYDIDENEDYVYGSATTSRNLCGLLNKKCVCVGFSVILKNILSCVGIKSIILSSDDHEFIKVKIYDKWYYCDLTKDAFNIKKYNEFKYCLLSK